MRATAIQLWTIPLTSLFAFVNQTSCTEAIAPVNESSSLGASDQETQDSVETDDKVVQPSIKKPGIGEVIGSIETNIEGFHQIGSIYALATKSAAGGSFTMIISTISTTKESLEDSASCGQATNDTVDSGSAVVAQTILAVVSNPIRYGNETEEKPNNVDGEGFPINKNMVQEKADGFIESGMLLSYSGSESNQMTGSLTWKNLPKAAGDSFEVTADLKAEEKTFKATLKGQVITPACL